ncbi:MAG: glycine--tRNA ligase [bacterium]|nr:glycine--tRNA ligase [bacterium]
MSKKPEMSELVAFCKSRGFAYQSSEIYGGMSAIYDYGHYGTLLKNNIRDAWWKNMVQEHAEVLALDSAIFMAPLAWKASGHLDNFDDPQVDCKTCKARLRADHLLEEFGISADKQPLDFINQELDKLKKENKLKCPVCGGCDLTPAKRFSLMVKSNIGAPTDELTDENVVYLRPETCGGIYLNYKNIIDSLHPKLPFGVAQVGKAFRNEIIARQFIFRTREFEQMEMQYFLRPEQMVEKFAAWKADRWQWYLNFGIQAEKIRWYKHEKLAHYASDAYDIEYDFQFLGGFKEIEGIHARGDWDLSQHGKFSGCDLSYTDPYTNEKFIPHIMETSVGLGRLFLMFLDQAYTKESVNDGERLVLKLDPRLSPIKVAVFPLLRNKPELVALAQDVAKRLRPHYQLEFDDHGNIGKRYRRQDEIGTPLTITVDFDSLTNQDVTVRERDSMQQTRVSLAKLEEYLHEKLGL